MSGIPIEPVVVIPNPVPSPSRELVRNLALKHTEASETLKQEQAFHAWFQTATGNAPYPFQVRFACETTVSELGDVPTGLGKTAMVVLG